MLLQIIGDAADGVGEAAGEVLLAVAVQIHGVAAIAAGHELRNADGAGVRTLQSQGVDARVARVQQVVLQFAAEEFGARRVVEGERGERIDDAVAAGVAAVHRFHADDGDDDFFGHAIEGGGARERLALPLAEFDARLDALAREKQRAIGLPGLRARLGGRGDRCDDGGLEAGVAE